MKNLVWIVLLVVLTGCAGHQKNEINENTKPQGRYIQIPRWFLNVPAGDFSIGIAKLTISDMDVKISALQNATVTYCRNHNCYVVNNEAIRNTQITTGSGKSEFQVVVTSKPQQLHEIRDKLKLLDYFWFYDNFISIYSIQKCQIDSTRINLWINEKTGDFYPDWFNGELIVDTDHVYTDVSGNSHDMFHAWQEALDAGRVSLAGYSNIKVDATVYHVNGVRDRLISLETSLKMNNIEINKIYVRRYLGSGGPGYTVYMRMGMNTGS